MDFKKQRQELTELVVNLEKYDFEAVALSLFRFQYQYNTLYQSFVDCLNVKIANVSALSRIPFLPVSFFKTHTVKTGSFEAQTIFSSSGTTGQLTSKHHLTDTRVYDSISLTGFSRFYGPVQDFCFLALLPSYLERPDSSLVHMCSTFIAQSKYRQSGFFLNNYGQLLHTIEELKRENIPTILIGVSYALLDFADQYQPDLSGIIVMETGGMKGKRQETTKVAMHAHLKDNFNVKEIHSEYGMTELLSQGYSKGAGVFYPSATMRVLTSEIADPLSIQKLGKVGTVQIIDLANIDSCAFIATQDLGICHEDGGFEIIGRQDNSDIRGCNLMVE
jgi:hypothetical protein